MANMMTIPELKYLPVPSLNREAFFDNILFNHHYYSVILSDIEINI